MSPGSGKDKGWVVRPVSGQAARKSYVCPGCQQDIPARTPHIVAWQEVWPNSLDDRRHWHTPCWRRAHPTEVIGQS